MEDRESESSLSRGVVLRDHLRAGGTKVKSLLKILIPLAPVFLCHVAVADEHLKEIDASLATAFQHARNFPVVFESDAQREDLEIKLGNAIDTLKNMIEASGPDKELLLRIAIAHTYAYNLDWPDSKKNVESHFSQLFQIDPENPEGHLFFGAHLSGAGDPGRSIPHLKLAADCGHDTPALFMLGLAHYRMNETDKARDYFLRVQELVPNDLQIRRVLDSIDPSVDPQFRLRNVFVQ